MCVSQRDTGATAHPGGPAPNHYEDYIHRIGRTGRAGKKGTAYTFMPTGGPIPWDSGDGGSGVVRLIFCATPYLKRPKAISGNPRWATSRDSPLLLGVALVTLSTSCGCL